MWGYLQKESSLSVNSDSFLKDKIELTEPKYIIGRKQSKSDAVTLLVNDKRISSEHLSIEKQNDKFFLTDLSSNGTFLNGKKMVPKKTQFEIFDQDIISFPYSHETSSKVLINIVLIFFNLEKEEEVVKEEEEEEERSENTQELEDPNSSINYLIASPEYPEEKVVVTPQVKEKVLNVSLSESSSDDEPGADEKITKNETLIEATGQSGIELSSPGEEKSGQPETKTEQTSSQTDDGKGSGTKRQLSESAKNVPVGEGKKKKLKANVEGEPEKK